METYLSLVICTHNPRRDYLDKVLKALQAQTLPVKQWELLLIDNASDELLSSKIDLSWHPQARYIREEKLGLTPARLRGIKEADGEILVFVDDDNILDNDYLEIALQISRNYPMIGAWGGQIRPGFEELPPEWTKPFLPFLAIREFEQDKWSNLSPENETTPCGAGLCIRKVVAENYTELVSKDPRRADMDRKGNSLMCSGDIDLALTACDMGLGTGQFTSLNMTHLMPPNRLNEDYLLRMVQGSYYSGTILNYLRGKHQSYSSWRTLNIYLLYLRMRYGSKKSRFYQASQKGISLALKKIKNWQNQATKNA
ncbi:glycosyltransferase [Nostoc sphaeroides]|uniref:Family 2 glycosyl transferase n=1 Tax=Nostoc sphaeroides CCNUC1 TaxID=2653204 RepID=A0A5P8WBZ1_9NOSO|nr:glycosyltransferase [Nostoc sphaeroides]QFS50337.1 family 2 glycosyl transferase [Nostoc sphaeroides CCNUC1]